MPPPSEQPYVRIGLDDIFAKLVNVEAIVANLATNATHAEAWRVEADKDIDEVKEKLSGFVTRRELFTYLTAATACIGAAAPFVARLYA